MVGYAHMMAEAGVSISRAGSTSEHRPTLTGIGVYILWLVNLLIAIGVAVMMALDAVSTPLL